MTRWGLRHIIGRGMERGKIFQDDFDRNQVNQAWEKLAKTRGDRLIETIKLQK